MSVRRDLAPTGVLRASINLGNPVLAHGTAVAPGGVTVDIAIEIAARLDVQVQLLCFDAARESFAAMQQGLADICFLAIDPVRARSVAFTAPYAVIEGVFAVCETSPITTGHDVDQDGVRVGVTSGSAYDLHLSRTLRHATVVPYADGFDAFAEHHVAVVAGLRGPMEQYAATQGGIRVLEPAFMEIRQAVGTSTARASETIRFLHELVEELKCGGFIRESLRRAGHTHIAVAPPAG